MSNFISGIIVGIIILQTAVFAPTLFKTLDMPSAGALLRALFPKFFVLIALLGASLLAFLLSQTGSSVLALGVGGGSFVFPILCRLMVPATNKARDEGDDKRFKRLHMWSVILTLLVLFGNIAMPFLA